MESENMTVRELVNQNSHNKIWLCPSIASNTTFQNDPLLRGIECTKSTVPEKLKDKFVDKHFEEDNFLCIIWKNNDSANPL